MDRDKETELEQGLVHAIKVTTKYLAIVDGVIQSVDADPTNADSSFTCTVQVGDSQTVVNKVPLSVLVGSQGGLVVVPAVNSACEVGFRDGVKERPFLQLVDQVQAWYLTISGITIAVTGNGIKINGGNNGGIPLAKAVENAGVAGNNILTAILNILSGPPINEPGNGSPSALQQALSASVAGLQVGDYSSGTIENSKISQ